MSTLITRRRCNHTTAFKLVRKRKDGSLGPLFVERNRVFDPGIVLFANPFSKIPQGLSYRPGFHCCTKPEAPHIKLRLKSGEERVWCEVLLADYVKHLRPACFGGMWLVGQVMEIIRVL